MEKIYKIIIIIKKFFFLKATSSFPSAPKFPEILYQIHILLTIILVWKAGLWFSVLQCKVTVLLGFWNQIISDLCMNCWFSWFSVCLRLNTDAISKLLQQGLSLSTVTVHLSGSCQCAQREFTDLQINPGSQKIKEHIHACAPPSLHWSMALQVNTSLVDKAPTYLYIMDFSGI